MSAFKNKPPVRKGLKKGNLPKGKIYYNFFAHTGRKGNKMKKILSFVMAVLMIAGAFVMLVSCTEQDKIGEQVKVLDEVALGETFTVPETFKIGFILLHDENSTYDLNFINAALKIKEYLGLTDEQVILEKNIPEEGTDCYDAAIRLVNKGCSVIFADSFGHEDMMIKAAEENPNVQFCHATGTKALVKELPNYHNAFASIYEGRFLAGIAAGMKLNEMIKSGKITTDEAIIGYVGAYPYAEVVSGYTSFFLGARSVCPSATMKVRYTSTWYDYELEKEAATTLIEIDKCVLISQHADSLGAPSTCEIKGVPNVSYNGSTVEAGPNTFIISSAINWAPYYYYIIKSAVEGTDIAANWCGTIETGSVILSTMNSGVAADGTVVQSRPQLLNSRQAHVRYLIQTPSQLEARSSKHTLQTLLTLATSRAKQRLSRTDTLQSPNYVRLLTLT